MGTSVTRVPEGGSLGWANPPTGVGPYPRERASEGQGPPRVSLKKQQVSSGRWGRAPFRDGIADAREHRKAFKVAWFSLEEMVLRLESERLNGAAALRMISSLTRKPQIGV